MNKITLKAKNGAFDAIFLKALNPTRKIIFAAGRGGDPERYLPLLRYLAERGCTVIAPYFERIFSSIPDAEELLLRVDSLLAAMDFIDESSLPLVGIGHSIGATLLTALAGGQMWMPTRQRLSIARDGRLEKLVLLTPPTGFFQAPGALTEIYTPMQAWAGSNDTITPPEQIEFLKKALPPEICLDFRLIEGAGHFSFMNILPPSINDSMINREEFLDRLATEVCRFVVK